LLLFLEKEEVGQLLAFPETSFLSELQGISVSLRVVGVIFTRFFGLLQAGRRFSRLLLEKEECVALNSGLAKPRIARHEQFRF
jgi:hypothetical protein